MASSAETLRLGVLPEGQVGGCDKSFGVEFVVGDYTFTFQQNMVTDQDLDVELQWISSNLSVVTPDGVQQLCRYTVDAQGRIAAPYNYDDMSPHYGRQILPEIKSPYLEALVPLLSNLKTVIDQLEGKPDFFSGDTLSQVIAYNLEQTQQNPV